jgi:thymidylate synthase
MNSRRAVFTNLYDNGLGKCISLVHLFCRDGKAYINQYYRSQEFNKNFAYDFQTAIILMKKAMNELNVKPGLIIVFVANLHKEIE